MINNKKDGLSVFKWLNKFKDFHKNDRFYKKYDKDKIKIKEPGYEKLHQSAPLHVITHPYMLRKWMALYTMAGNKSFSKVLIESQTSAELL